jgi:hypothetical protein
MNASHPPDTPYLSAARGPCARPSRGPGLLLFLAMASALWKRFTASRTRVQLFSLDGINQICALTRVLVRSHTPMGLVLRHTGTPLPSSRGGRASGSRTRRPSSPARALRPQASSNKGRCCSSGAIAWPKSPVSSSRLEASRDEAMRLERALRNLGPCPLLHHGLRLPPCKNGAWHARQLLRREPYLADTIRPLAIRCVRSTQEVSPGADFRQRGGAPYEGFPARFRAETPLWSESSD